MTVRDACRQLGLAASFATIVPMPMASSEPASADALRRSMGWLPVVGIGLGLGLFGAAWLSGHVLSRLTAAVVVLALYTLATGALHLDGLADTWDALGSRKSAAGALAIMKDSRIGTMGTVAVVLVLMGKAASFAQLPLDSPAPWVVVPVLARTAVVWAMAWAPAARANGLGTLYAHKLPPSTIALATVVGLGVAVVALPLPLALGLSAAFALVVWGWSSWMTRRFLGATGDTYGALLEIAEWLGFLALAGTSGGWLYGH
jgi:adenosylcobinamide-GDP ribazoletransferase